METTELLENLRRQFSSMEAAVSARLSPKRWQHIQGVVTAALRLARRWGADPKKAYVAALLHDVAREYSSNRLLKTTVEFGIVLTASERATVALIHAPVGAAIAETEFHVTDPDVLAAIRYHTTGRAGMSLLEKIIFLADYIEPGRSFPGVERARTVADQSLDEAVLLAMTQSMTYLLQNDLMIAVETVEARNELLVTTTE